MNKSLVPFLLPSLALGLLLQSCGGSSSGGETPIVVPVDYNFSLTAQLANECGVKSAFTDVELLLQDDTWQTLASYQPDENGVISFVTQSEFINYTLVAKNQKGTEPQGLNIVSYYQASSVTPSYYQAQFDENIDNSTCECVTQNVELTHDIFASQSSVTSSLSYESWQEVDGKTTLFEGVKICHEIGASWPSHSFSVTGFDLTDTEIASAAFNDDFTASENGVWQVNAFSVAKMIDLTQLPHQEFMTNQLIGTNTHFMALVTEDVESLLIFNNHDHINDNDAFYQSRASVSFAESSSIVRNVDIKTHHQIISTSSDVAFSVKANEQKPNLNEELLSEIEADYHYDYSTIKGFPVAIIALTFTVYDSDTKLLTPIKWTSYGPESGALAISGALTGYEDIFDINDDFYIDKKSTDVRLIKSEMAADYQDYIQFYQGGNTVESTIDNSNDLIKDLHQIEIKVEFN